MAIKTIKEESLTALGNAIRIKTGNEDLLEFPNGMVNAISGIETSGAIEALDITANGIYNAPEGVDGYNPITVNVPQKEPNIQNLSITTNGTYTAPTGTDGYSPVVVDVQPDLEDITITANGTYTHSGKDGYDQVVVNVPQEGLDVSEITIETDPSNLFSSNKWSQLMPYFRNINISVDNYYSEWRFLNLYRGCSYTDLSHITFKIKSKQRQLGSFSSAFTGCSQLRKLPNFDWSSAPVSQLTSSIEFNSIFSSCSLLRTISKTFFTDIPFSSSSVNVSYLDINNMFSSCYSLRELPDLSIFHGLPLQSYGSSAYGNQFQNCASLNEIVDLYILTPTSSDSSNNMFYYTFNRCMRVKRVTLKTDNGQPIVSSLHSQTIDLSDYLGWAADSGYIINHNSGITADKEVTDDVSYQALKNDPDWFTCNVAYSRYNHDSAVETINSLPDCSGAGTNTIKFKGAAGSATDGGAINTLTEEEIAVATAKGWTVSLS